MLNRDFSVGRKKRLIFKQWRGKIGDEFFIISAEEN